MTIVTRAEPYSVSPATVKQRIEVIDITRGFALLGVLLANMGLYNLPVYASFLEPYPGKGLDRLAGWFVGFAAQGESYPLFSFLFGLGLYLLMSRVEADGVRFAPLYMRRLLVLLGLGIIHAFGFSSADILIPYAGVGFLLFGFRNRSPRTLLIGAVVSFALALAIQGGTLGLVQLGRAAVGDTTINQAIEQSRTQMIARNVQAIHVYSQGTLSEILSQHATDSLYLATPNLMAVPSILAFFLLGLYVGKREIFCNIAQYLPLFRRLLVIGLAVGVPFSLLYVVTGERSSPIVPSGMGFLSWLSLMIGGPALAMAYLCAIVLLAQNEIGRKRLAPLACAGRMAISNYLIQTLVCTTIFYHYGLGLYGKVGPATGLVLAGVIYLAQMLLSVWWLQRFRFGPVEWLWRSLTYGRWLPM